MSDLIELNPEILGGKPIIKGTRTLVALIYELVGMNYTSTRSKKSAPILTAKSL